MLIMDNVSYTYPNGRCVLKNISLTIKKGEFAAIIGRNGSGKTTLLKHFNGLLRPVCGKALVNGLDTGKVKTSRLAQQVGFLFQNPDHQIFCPTVYDEIAFGLKKMKTDKKNIDRKVREAAEKVSIDAFLDLSPFSLSKGQRQKVALASVLAAETEIIILDEPTTGQDFTEGIEIMEIIRNLNKHGKTVVMVTHDMELVAGYARRAIILHEGCILEDGPVNTVLGRQESLVPASLQSPQICQLSRRFHKHGLFKNVFTAEDMFDEIMAYLEEDKNVCTG